jgi:hypothetical protein
LITDAKYCFSNQVNRNFHAVNYRLKYISVSKIGQARLQEENDESKGHL